MNLNVTSSSSSHFSSVRTKTTLKQKATASKKRASGKLNDTGSLIFHLNKYICVDVVYSSVVGAVVIVGVISLNELDELRFHVVSGCLSQSNV